MNLVKCIHSNCEHLFNYDNVNTYKIEQTLYSPGYEIPICPECKRDATDCIEATPEEKKEYLKELNYYNLNQEPNQ